MCLNLKKSEKTILAFDVNEWALDKAEKRGIQCVDSLPDIGLAGCDIVFTMLPGDDAVHEVMPVLMNTWPCILVDCSTVSPTTSRHWHSQVARDEGPSSAMFDAPVSGGVKVKESFFLSCAAHEFSIQSGSHLTFFHFVFMFAVARALSGCPGCYSHLYGGRGQQSFSCSRSSTSLFRTHGQACDSLRWAWYVFDQFCIALVMFLDRRLTLDSFPQ